MTTLKLAPEPDEPIGHLEAPRPQTFRDLIGMHSAKTQLRAVINAYRKGVPLNSMMFYGGAGGGKTTLAHVLANEIDLPFHETIGDMLKKPEQVWKFCEAMAPDLERHGAVIAFVDEIHALKNQAKLWLPLLENRRLFHGLSGRAYIREQFADGSINPRLLKRSEEANIMSFMRITGDISHYRGIVWVGATTDPDQCGAPILRRFGTKIMVPDYTEKQVLQVVTRASKKMLKNVSIPLGNMDKKVLPLIASRSRMSPAEGVNILQNLLPHAVDKKLTVPRARKVLKDLDIGPHGVKREDLLALRFMLKNGIVGVNSLKQVLASKGVSPRMYSTQVEPFLLRMGFAKITKGGRTILQDGVDVLEGK